MNILPLKPYVPYQLNIQRDWRAACRNFNENLSIKFLKKCSSIMTKLSVVDKKTSPILIVMRASWPTTQPCLYVWCNRLTEKMFLFLNFRFISVYWCYLSGLKIKLCFPTSNFHLLCFLLVSIFMYIWSPYMGLYHVFIYLLIYHFSLNQIFIFFWKLVETFFGLVCRFCLFIYSFRWICLFRLESRIAFSILIKPVTTYKLTILYYLFPCAFFTTENFEYE